LGGSPDQLNRYRERLSKALIPSPPFKKEGGFISVIQWLADSFEYYPKCWTEQPAGFFYYPAEGPFFEKLPQEAMTTFFIGSAGIQE